MSALLSRLTLDFILECPSIFILLIYFVGSAKDADSDVLVVCVDLNARTNYSPSGCRELCTWYGRGSQQVMDHPGILPGWLRKLVGKSQEFDIVLWKDSPHRLQGWSVICCDPLPYTVPMSPSKVIVHDIVTQVLDNPSTVIGASSFNWSVNRVSTERPNSIHF